MVVSEIKEVLKEIFEEEEGRVSSVDSVFELSENEEFYKLVISIHNLSFEDTLIIHTKFIFKTDLAKSKLLEDSFIYLYDINCVYHRVDYSNKIDLKNKIDDIIKSNNFGMDLQILSDFIEAPAMFLNYYMKRSKIVDYSVFEVRYEPKFKTTPCDKTSFDFEININNNYMINLTITKKDAQDKEDVDSYKFHFSLLDEYKTVTTDSLKNIHFTIGSNIAKMLDDKLK
jgi:hypothetical protein